jgi:hypothetical protein
MHSDKLLQSGSVAVSPQQKGVIIKGKIADAGGLMPLKNFA